jgi:hypothetical protein
MNRTIFLIAIVQSFFLISINASAKTIFVGKNSPYKTIQAGVDASSNNDSIIIDKGIYTGNKNRNIVIREKDLYIRSLAGYKETIIDCESDGFAFNFDHANCTLEGLTIQNSKYDLDIDIFMYLTKTDNAAAIISYESDMLITNCEIKNNNECGIANYHSENIMIKNSVIHNCDKHGIYNSASDTDIYNCTILNNAYGVYSTKGSIFGGISKIRIVNTIFWMNGEGDIYNYLGWIFKCKTTVNFSNVSYYKGNNNISGDPCFVNLEEENFELKSDSPCKDAGDDVSGMYSDIRGSLRPMNKKYDMGAFEYSTYQKPFYKISVNGRYDQTSSVYSDTPVSIQWYTSYPFPYNDQRIIDNGQYSVSIYLFRHDEQSFELKLIKGNLVVETGNYFNEYNCQFSDELIGVWRVLIALGDIEATNQITTSESSVVIYPKPYVPPEAQISGYQQICRGDSATLQFDISNGIAPYTVVYSDGEKSYTINEKYGSFTESVSPQQSTWYQLESITDKRTRKTYSSDTETNSAHIVVNQELQRGEPPVIGPSIACAGHCDYTYVYTYTANFLNTVNSYEWSVSSSDAEIISSPFGKKIKVRFTVNQPENFEVNIQVKATNYCGSLLSTFPVKLITDCTWPGDVNYNNQIDDTTDENNKLIPPVELTDFNLLSSFTMQCLSLANRIGPRRSVSCDPKTGECYLNDNYSYTWAPQPSLDWISWANINFKEAKDKKECIFISKNLLFGNLKHFDTNGNGKIEPEYPYDNDLDYDPLTQAPRNDTEVIAFILTTHPLKPPRHNIGALNDNRRNRSHVITSSADVNISLISESHSLSSTEMLFEITIGSESNPITDVSGVNFELRLEKGSWENPVFLYRYFSLDQNTYIHSHLGRQSSNMTCMSLIHSDNKNVALIAMQRTDGDSVTFSGEMLLRIRCTFPAVNQALKRNKIPTQKIPVEIAVTSSNGITSKCDVKALTSSSTIVYLDNVYPPDSPSELTAQTISQNLISLKWKDNSETEEAFIVERATGTRDTFVAIATLTKDSTAYTDCTIQSESTYFYRIKATNQFGNAYSNEVNEIANMSPIISPVDDQMIDKNTSCHIRFTIDDQETLPGNLMVSTHVSNDTMIQSLEIGGDAKERFLKIIASDHSHGQSTVTITVNDGTKSTDVNFTLTVTDISIKFLSDQYIGNPDNILHIPIQLDNADKVPIEGISVTLSFDPAIITPLSCILSDTLNTDYQLYMNNLDGTAKIGIMTNRQIVPHGGIIAFLNVKMIGTQGARTSLEFTHAELNEIRVHTQNCFITINDQPKAMAREVVGIEDHEINGNISAIDAVGESLTYTIVERPAMGDLTLNVNTGSFSYHPFFNQHGKDFFTFKATDGLLDSNVAAVTLTITPEPDAPTISYIDSQFSWMNSQVSPIEFSIGDIDNNDQLFVTALSDNTELVNSENIDINCSGNKCFAVIKTNEGQYGATQIKLSVHDAEHLFSHSTFDLFVGGVKLEIPSKKYVYSEDIIELPLRLWNHSNEMIKSIHIDFHFEPEYLQTTEQYVLSTLLNQNDYTQEVNVNNDEGHITLDIMASSIPVTLSGTIVNLIFNSSAQSPVGRCISIKSKNAEMNQQTIHAQACSVCFTETILSGDVHYYNKTLADAEKPVSDVVITLSGERSYTTTTNESGHYTFNDLKPGNFELTAYKKDSTNTGLNSIDAATIAQSSVDIVKLNCYQKIAADVTRNGKITPMDASHVARFKIGLTECLNKDCIHWAFVSNPIQACSEWDTNSIIYSSDKSFFMNQNKLNTNFIAIKLGDVDNTWSNSSSTIKRRRKKTVENTIEKTVIKGHPFSIPLCLRQKTELTGIDMQLAYDSTGIDAIDVMLNQDTLKTSDYQLMKNFNTDGKITFMIYSTSNPIEITGVFATIHLTATGEVNRMYTINVLDFDCNGKSSEGLFGENLTSNQVSVKVLPDSINQSDMGLHDVILVLQFLSDRHVDEHDQGLIALYDKSGNGRIDIDDALLLLKKLIE